ncbi:Fanconi anemia core complex-associated protein 100 [Embiotoca jacksoni]|uniref:Fanconi anemia core complex-associated protein 100 n=1 Tax=Embiotoca jacksoni TaxID=100190 RepID=UPI0037038F99
MEGRCAVDTWTEFGFSGASSATKVKFGFGTDVIICTATDEVYVFNAHERKLKAVLQLPGPVSDLVESQDKQLLYVACQSGVYCVNLPSLLHRAQSCPDDAASGPAELQVSSECLVVGADGVSSLLLIGSLLLTLCQGDTSWLLTLYKTESSSYEVLGSFSLPLVSAVGNGDAGSKTGLRRSVLVCVHSGDITSLSSSPESSEATLRHSHFCLDLVLFKLLFGVEAALAKSPVILCGLPDGRLCFVPLRVPGSRLRALHSLEQPVVFVGASAVTGPGHAQCLVAVGDQGRVVLIKTDKPEREGSIAGFTEWCVAGPVVCGCVDKTSLYYSTGSDLLVLDLSEGSSGREGKERDEDSSRKTAAALQSPTSLNVCRLIALAKPTCSAAGAVELLGLSVRGQLQKISLPVKREDAGLFEPPSIQVGRSVRDVLSAIGDVCERASVLKTAIKSKNQILTHLNHVLNISFLLMASTNTEEHLPVEEKPIRCHATASWSRLLQKDSLNLSCVLDNSSPYVLEQGWTLSVTVSPLSCPSTAGGERSSTNFSFPFNSLHPGETLEVSLPVAAAGGTSFPVTVNCSLINSLSSFLGEDEAGSSPGSQGSCVSLPLNTLTVDWLHALQVESPASTRKVSSSPSCGMTTDSIQAFLSSRQMRCSGRAEGGGGSASKPEKYSASVRVSSELLRETLVLKSSDLDPEGPKLGPQNLCVSLLDWLLSEGPGGVKSQGEQVVLNSSVVHARGPNGATVKLTAKEMNNGEEESLPTVEVQVESSSLAAVCGLHHAVLRRMQTLLQKAPQKAASEKRVQTLGLTRALQRAEIQQSQISGAYGAGTSSEQMNRVLLCVYQELRENPLLII